MVGKRSNGEGSVRKTKNGSWRGEIMDGYTPDGKETVLLDGEDQKHMHRQLIEFKKLTEGKPSEMPTAEYGRSVMRLIDKIYCGRE